LEKVANQELKQKGMKKK